jgi:hypothetical protein
MAYIFNIGHRLFPRDATEDLPSRRTPLPVFTRRHIVPALSAPGFPLAGSAIDCSSLSVASFRNLAPALFGGPFGRRRRTPPHAIGQHASTRAPHAARSSPANPFWRARRTPVLRAPNLQRLRQSGDARQDLVRKSESTTKCGDYGEESGGDAQVSKIRRESERPMRVLYRFHSRPEPNRAERRAVSCRGCELRSTARTRADGDERHVFVTHPR